MRDQTYLLRYKKGKQSIISGFALILFAIGVILFCAVAGWVKLMPVAVTFCLFSFGYVFLVIKEYREIRLYHNRMEVISVIGGTIAEIYFRDITKVGFAKGIKYYGSRRRGGVEANELVILLRDGSRQMLGDDEYDDLPAVCAFIKEKLGLK